MLLNIMGENWFAPKKIDTGNTYVFGLNVKNNKNVLIVYLGNLVVQIASPNVVFFM